MEIRHIGVMIADPQFLIREGLKRLFATYPHVHVTGEATTREELLGGIRKQRPEVVILDYGPPGHFSTEDVRLIKEASPLSQVLVISSDMDKEKVMQALEYGAKGFLTKECGEVEILGAVQATAQAEKFFCNKVLDILLERQLNPEKKQDPCLPVQFTDREGEIIAHMARGLNAPRIARNLDLSVHTVYTHRRNIMKKLQVTTAAEVILYALRTRMVEP